MEKSVKEKKRRFNNEPKQIFLAEFFFRVYFSPPKRLRAKAKLLRKIRKNYLFKHFC